MKKNNEERSLKRFEEKNADNFFVKSKKCQGEAREIEYEHEIGCKDGGSVNWVNN